MPSFVSFPNQREWTIWTSMYPPHTVADRRWGKKFFKSPTPLVILFHLIHFFSFSAECPWSFHHENHTISFYIRYSVLTFVSTCSFWIWWIWPFWPWPGTKALAFANPFTSATWVSWYMDDHGRSAVGIALDHDFEGKPKRSKGSKTISVR